MAGDYEIVTFDCYGTLVDWRQGILRAFQDAGLMGPNTSAEQLLRYHAEVEPVVQQEGYRPYAEVLRLTAQRMIDRMGGEPPSDDGEFLPRSVPSWPVFPDTNAALTRLRATGMELGILSNIDDDLLHQTLRQIDVDVALVVTAEQVQAYKPTRAHFRAAAKLVGQRRWLHAAQSYFHDIEPAHTLGIPSAWVNRLGERRSGHAQPTFEVPDLKHLADRLAV